MVGSNGYFFSVDGPLLAPPPPGTMRACGFVDGLETLVRQRGGNVASVLERHGIDPNAARDNDYPIPCQDAATLLEYCSSTFDDRLFGLRLGQRLHTDVYGSITTFARVAPDIRTAIAILLDFMPVLYCPGAKADLCVARETAELRWQPLQDFSCDEQANGLGQSQVLRFFQGLIGPQFRPTAVHIVSQPWHRDLDDMEQAFGCRVHGNSPANIITFPASYLDRPLRSSNAMLYGLLSSYFAQVKDSEQRTLVDDVRAYVRAHLSTGSCTIERCAAHLQISARTIQRRLVEQGMRFSEIVEEQIVETAKRALTGTDDPLTDIALTLGYSDQSSFGRAFKRWTGRTPHAFREARPARA